jgi:hypothetical protein
MEEDDYDDDDEFYCTLYLEKYTKIVNIGVITPLFNHVQSLY